MNGYTKFLGSCNWPSGFSFVVFDPVTGIPMTSTPQALYGQNHCLGYPWDCIEYSDTDMTERAKIENFINTNIPVESSNNRRLILTI